MQRYTKRREFLTLLGGAVAWPLAAAAQQRVPRVGVLLLGAPLASKDLVIASELARLGYIAGQTIVFEVRGAEGDLRRLSILARELVATKPDVLIGAGSQGAEALSASTRTIPIVMTVIADPVATGLTDSMSRPSRNLTGFTISIPALAAKRLELLRELIPGLRRVAYLSGPAGAVGEIFEQQVRNAAKALGISLFAVTVTETLSVPAAFAIIDREKVEAVLVEANPINIRQSGHIIDECSVRDLPSIHPWAFEVRAGALMSYGPKELENHAGVAQYVDRILKGAKVADLPFQDPTEINLAINLRTARSLNLTIPTALLVRADAIVE
jgi:putative ABC transport system substrate-binding protein